MDVTADVVVAAQQVHHTGEVVGASGIESRCNAVLCGLGRKDARLDIVVEDVVLILDADEALDKVCQEIGERTGNRPYAYDQGGVLCQP